MLGQSVIKCIGKLGRAVKQWPQNQHDVDNQPQHIQYHLLVASAQNLSEVVPTHVESRRKGIYRKLKKIVGRRVDRASNDSILVPSHEALAQEVPVKELRQYQPRNDNGLYSDVRNGDERHQAESCEAVSQIDLARPIPKQQAKAGPDDQAESPASRSISQADQEPYDHSVGAGPSKFQHSPNESVLVGEEENDANSNAPAGLAAEAERDDYYPANAYHERQEAVDDVPAEIDIPAQAQADQIAGLLERLDSSDSTIREQQRRLAQNAEQMAAQQYRINRLEGELAANANWAVNGFQALQGQLNRLEHEVLLNQRSQMQREASQDLLSRSEHAALQERLGRLEHELQMTKEELVLREEHSRLELDELAELRQAVADDRAREAAQLDQWRNYGEALDSALREWAALHRDLKILTNKISEKNEQLKQHQAQIASLVAHEQETCAYFRDRLNRPQMDSRGHAEALAIRLPLIIPVNQEKRVRVPGGAGPDGSRAQCVAAKPSLRPLSALPEAPGELDNPYLDDAFSTDNTEVIETLNSGAQGTVSLLFSKATRQRYVRKYIKLEGANIYGALHDSRERHFLRLLGEHAHIVKLEHVCIYPSFAGQVSMALLHFEYCTGGDLKTAASTLRRHNMPLSSRDIWLFVLHMAKALAHMHGWRFVDGEYRMVDPVVIHRDIKPDNILVRNPAYVDGFNPKQPTEYVLADLGFAEHESLCSALCGTDSYIPPEMRQYWGQTEEQARIENPLSGLQRTATDMWCFGATLLFFMTGCIADNYDLQLMDGKTVILINGRLLCKSHFFDEGLWFLLASLLNKQPDKRGSSEQLPLLIRSAEEKLA